VKARYFLNCFAFSLIVFPRPWVGAAEPKQYAGESLKKSPDITIVGRQNFDSRPKFLQGAAPVYPIRQLQLANSGETLIEFTITANGDARDFRVISTSYKSFADHAILAVQKWKWEPARKQVHLVAVRVRLPFHYVTISRQYRQPSPLLKAGFRDQALRCVAGS
jgi:TonB family protein